MSLPKRKLTSLSIEQKIEILDVLQAKKKTRKEVMLSYGIGMATITRIVQQEAKIRGVALENGNTARKRLRKGIYDEIDQAVSVWFHQMRANNAVISGPVIQEKAKIFAQLLNIPNFEPSNGWLGRWKAKENVRFYKLQGEKASADHIGATDWVQKVLPSILAEYSAEDIYNADESGLFYKALPIGAMACRGDKPGGKIQKDRLTVLFLCNMDGSDKNIFIIGREKQPHCFRGKKIPLPYYANSKAWMTSPVWTKILTDFDNMMKIQKRKVLLFVDNASCHTFEEDIVLENVKLQFLPANTTSIIQPLGQGIIRAFKVYYRQNIIRQQLLALEKGLSLQQFAETITVLEAMKLIEQSWDSVTSTTIQNCYCKAGFVKKAGERELEDEDAILQLLIPEIEFDTYVDCDANLDCYGELSADDIVDEVLKQRSDQDEREEEEVEERQSIPSSPTCKDALIALSVLRTYIENKNGDLNNVIKLEDQLCDMNAEYFVQKKISDFFK